MGYMFRGGLTDVGRAYRNQWWRIALVQFIALLGLTAVLAVCALLVQRSIPDLMAFLSADAGQAESRAIGIASVLILVLAVLSVPFVAAGAAATAAVADASLAGRRPRIWRSIGRGFARLLPIVGTAVLAFLLIGASLILTPLISIVGLVGLAASGVIALVRRRKPDAAAGWPAWKLFGFAAIPFAWFGRLTATALLMIPAAVLEPAGPIAAYRAADKAATGRRPQILALMAIAFLVAVGLSVGATLLGAAIWGQVGGAVLGLIVQLVAVPIPIVAAVALYRRAAGPTGRMLHNVVAPEPERAALRLRRRWRGSPPSRLRR